MTPCTGRIRSRRTTCTGIPGGTQDLDLAVGDVCRNACQRGKYGAGGVVACVSAVFPRSSICYALYLLIGQGLAETGRRHFSSNRALRASPCGLTSTHTLASMLLLRIWQGKAVCASFALPLFFLSVLPDHEERGVEALDSRFSMWRVWAHACFLELVS